MLFSSPIGDPPPGKVSLFSASGSEAWGILFAGARHPRARPSAASCLPAEAGTGQQGAFSLAKNEPGPRPLLPVLSDLKGTSGL